MIVFVDTCQLYLLFPSFDLKVEVMIFLTTGSTLVIKIN